MLRLTAPEHDTISIRNSYLDAIAKFLSLLRYAHLNGANNDNLSPRSGVTEIFTLSIGH